MAGTGIFQLANNAESTLASGITAVATSLTVQTGDGALFPSTYPFRITLDDGAGTIEVVECTNRSTDTLTITRAQEGTSGSAFSSGDAVELRLTKEVCESFYGYVPISSVSLSSGSQHDFTLDNTTYSSFLLIVEDALVTSDTVQFKLSNNGGSTFVTNGQAYAAYISSASVTWVNLEVTSGEYKLGDCGTNTYEGVTACVTFSPAVGGNGRTLGMIDAVDMGASVVTSYRGHYESDGQANLVRLYSASATTFSSGRAFLMGTRRF